LRRKKRLDPIKRKGINVRTKKGEGSGKNVGPVELREAPGAEEREGTKGGGGHERK